MFDCARKALIAVAIAGVVLPTAAAQSRHRPDGRRVGFQTSRSFELGAGRSVRTFTLRERSGVILLNRVIAPRGALAVVDETIPHVAGVGVTTQGGRTAPLPSCRDVKDGSIACTQGEEWCPMPQATWHVRLAKLAGPAGLVRVDFVVGAPPTN